MSVIWLGVLAGLGLAVPVGAMSIMLFQTSATRGWRFGATAGSAMAVVDFLYALVTALVGASLSLFIAEWGRALSITGASILLALGVQTIFKSILRSTTLSGLETAVGGLGKTFMTFVGATFINPQTALYFLAIAPSVAGSGAASMDAGAPLQFAVGVLLGSIAWQQVLAFSGSLLHRRSDARLRFYTGLVGGALVVILAVIMLVEALG